MPKFTYIARDKKGERIEGALEVEDRQAVLSRLQSMNYFPIKIEDVTPKGKGGVTLSSLRGKVSSSELVSFNRQLADLVSAGIPLVKALSIILNQTQDEMMHDIVADLNKSVQGGDSMAQAMRRHPKTFNALSIALVRAGETGGMLPDVLQRLADFAEKEEELKGKIISSLAYPSIMVFAGIIVIIVLVMVVMPKITSVYSDLGQELPFITQIMMTITDVVAQYYWMVGIGLALGIFLLNKFLKTDDGKRMWDTAMLRIPVVGEVIQKRELALFARTLGNLIRNGVPILTALDITCGVVSNKVMQDEINQLAPSISQGGNMATTLGDSPHFPPNITSMIAVGEETAQLDKVLLKISDTCEQEVDRSLKTLTSMLEPIIILVLGVVVGFIVISMMLPIMSLDPSAG